MYVDMCDTCRYLPVSIGCKVYRMWRCKNWVSRVFEDTSMQVFGVMYLNVNRLALGVHSAYRYVNILALGVHSAMCIQICK